MEVLEVVTYVLYVYGVRLYDNDEMRKIHTHIYGTPLR